MKFSSEEIFKTIKEVVVRFELKLPEGDKYTEWCETHKKLAEELSEEDYVNKDEMIETVKWQFSYLLI